jgi:hypothetical protein
MSQNIATAEMLERAARALRTVDALQDAVRVLVAACESAIMPVEAVDKITGEHSIVKDSLQQLRDAIALAKPLLEAAQLDSMGGVAGGGGGGGFCLDHGAVAE